MSSGQRLTSGMSCVHWSLAIMCKIGACHRMGDVIDRQWSASDGGQEPWGHNEPKSQGERIGTAESEVWQSSQLYSCHGAVSLKLCVRPSPNRSTRMWSFNSNTVLSLDTVATVSARRQSTFNRPNPSRNWVNSCPWKPMQRSVTVLIEIIPRPGRNVLHSEWL